MDPELDHRLSSLDRQENLSQRVLSRLAMVQEETQLGMEEAHIQLQNYLKWLGEEESHIQASIKVFAENKSIGGIKTHAEGFQEDFQEPEHVLYANLKDEIAYGSRCPPNQTGSTLCQSREKHNVLMCLDEDVFEYQALVHDVPDEVLIAEAERLNFCLVHNMPDDVLIAEALRRNLSLVNTCEPKERASDSPMSDEAVPYHIKPLHDSDNDDAFSDGASENVNLSPGSEEPYHIKPLHDVSNDDAFSDGTSKNADSQINTLAPLSSRPMLYQDLVNVQPHDAFFLGFSNDGKVLEVNSMSSGTADGFHSSAGHSQSTLGIPRVQTCQKRSHIPISVHAATATGATSLEPSVTAPEASVSTDQLRRRADHGRDAQSLPPWQKSMEWLVNEFVSGW